MNQVALLDLGVLIYFKRVTTHTRTVNIHTRRYTWFQYKLHIIFIIVWPFIVVLCRSYTNKSRTISEYRIKTAYFACQITYRNTHKPVSLFYFIYYYYHRHHYQSHMKSLHINVFCCHHKALALMNQQRSKNDHSKTSAYIHRSSKWMKDGKKCLTTVYFFFHHKTDKNNILKCESWNGELFILLSIACLLTHMYNNTLEEKTTNNNIPFIIIILLKFIERMWVCTSIWNAELSISIYGAAATWRLSVLPCKMTNSWLVKWHYIYGQLLLLSHLL